MTVHKAWEDVLAVMISGEWHSVKEGSFKMLIDSHWEGGGYEFIEPGLDADIWKVYGPWSAIQGIARRTK